MIERSQAVKRLRERTCKACGAKFYWKPSFRRPRDYCPECRSGARVDQSIFIQSTARRLPNGKYVVVQCVYAGMIGNVVKKNLLMTEAYNGTWPEDMMLFNVKSRRVYKIQGEESTTQIIVLVSDPPETVKRRIKSSFPK